jgi:sulfopropanediol 3-dehydrogenase
MPRWLKRGMDAGAIKAADAKVRETVESILAQVDERKDAAIREMSEKFDKWSPKDFRLSPQEIERAISHRLDMVVSAAEFPGRASSASTSAAPPSE